MPIIVTAVGGDSSLFLDISAALDDRLSIMAGLPPVAWENRPYTPVIDTQYLRPINEQGDTVAITQDQDQTIGVYTVNIISPAGEGKNSAVVMADLVADHMKQDLSFSYNGQELRVKNVSRGKVISDDSGWLFCMVDVVYYAFSARR